MLILRYLNDEKFIILKINKAIWEAAEAQAQTHTTTANQMFTKTIRMNREM